MLEEFGPKFEHVEGKANKVADTLSRHPMEPVPSEATVAGVIVLGFGGHQKIFALTPNPR